MSQNDIHESRLVNVDEAARYLGISNGTVRNWIKHGYLNPAKESGKICFNYTEVSSLKENLSNGNIHRLRKRANKKNLSTTFLPIEYLADTDNIKDAEIILNALHAHDVSIDEGLFLVAVKLLIDAGLVKPVADFEKLLNFEDGIFNHRQIEREIKAWAADINFNSSKALWSEITSAHVPADSDFLGVIYQSLSQAGHKAKAGSYYTPLNIVEDMVKDNLHNKLSICLDPCCGTGQFLIVLAKRLAELGNKQAIKYIWGCDSDKTAVKIARLNLLIHFKDQDDITPQIYCTDTLLDGGDIFSSSQIYLKDNFFDLIVTNPPWGSKIREADVAQLESLFSFIKSRESFSYFIAKGMCLLKDNGILSYILPESFLNVNVHRDIRSHLLNNFTLNKIQYLDRAFKNVFTPAIRLDVQKKCANEEHTLEISKGNKTTIKQADLLKDENLVISITINDIDARILNKIYSQKHTTLVNNAEWALGIVTGNNDKFLSNEKLVGYEGVVKGKDVSKFIYNLPKCYINFKPDQLQQTAPEHKYRATEKLIYRFISKKLIFAYDDKQVLTLNSANILIPHPREHSLKVILGLFNSTLYQYIFYKKFNSIKVLRGHIEALPLPDWTEATYQIIISFVDRLLDPAIDQNCRASLFTELDEYIMRQWGLSESEMSHVIMNVSGKLEVL